VHEGDVRLFDPSEYAGRVDCIHAGFPCQDISNAGKQAGVGSDTRSGLYREVLRIADIVRPRYLFLENVSAILSNGLGTVFGDLAARGYDCRWTCLRAADVGAPHLRDRWWCLAEHAGIRDTDEYGESTGAVNAEASWLRGYMADAGSGRLSRPGGGQVQQPWRAEALGASEDVADACRARLQVGKLLCRSESNAGRAQQGQNAAVDCGAWWLTEPNVGRVAHGVASRMDRLKALGNGQVPLQAALAWRILTA
jgi:DNA (cytosine-5)-methyltransferase 1